VIISTLYLILRDSLFFMLYCSNTVDRVACYLMSLYHKGKNAVKKRTIKPGEENR